MAKPAKIHVITGGKYHDFNLARSTILNLMAEDERIRATCAQDFRGLECLDDYAGVVLYTCDLMPNEAETDALDNFVLNGGKIFALHAVNADLEFTDGPEIVASGVRIPGLVKPTAKHIAPKFMELIGSRFVVHLAAQEIHIHVEDSEHPITAGLNDFTVIDEPYVAEPLGEYHTLLSARYKGDAPGYVIDKVTEDPPRPQLYVKNHGKGGVLYTPLGHACGKYDMQPLMEEAPVVRGPWDDANYQEILRRGLAWIVDGNKG